MATWGEYAVSLCQALGVPVSQDNTDALLTWMAGEQPPDAPNAAYNPLNIQAGDSPHVSVTPGGQYNFASYDDGVNATARFILDNGYTGIVAALAQGNNALAVVVAIQDSPWASGHYGYGLPGVLNAVQSNRAYYMAGIIAGEGAPTGPEQPVGGGGGGGGGSFPSPPPVRCAAPFTM